MKSISTTCVVLSTLVFCIWSYGLLLYSRLLHLCVHKRVQYLGSTRTLYATARKSTTMATRNVEPSDSYGSSTYCRANRHRCRCSCRCTRSGWDRLTSELRTRDSSRLNRSSSSLIGQRRTESDCSAAPRTRTQTRSNEHTVLVRVLRTALAHVQRCTSEQ